MTEIVIIIGPTAIGKSNLAVNIAQKINAEIISADSMQIYKGMDIGTGKITLAEMQGVKHHLIDIINPSDSFSVTQYVEQAKLAITKILSNNKKVIITGGTGLYINALLNSHNFAQTEPNLLIRNKYAALALEKGNEYIYNLLKSIDTASADKIMQNDTKRIIRALEIYETTGIPKSEIINTSKCDFNYKLFVLNADRKSLYDRINLRVDAMFNNGLINEVKSLIDYKNCQSMQAIGYKETISYIENQLTINELTYKVKLNSRHYAKRQLTYFRWFDAENKIWLTEDYEENIIKNI